MGNWHYRKEGDYQNLENQWTKPVTLEFFKLIMKDRGEEGCQCIDCQCLTLRWAIFAYKNMKEYK